MRRTRSAEEAIDHLRHDYPDHVFRFTGLKKQCPRCNRQGHVLVYTSPGLQGLPGPYFAICWDGPSKLAKDAIAVAGGLANPHAVADFDLCVRLEDLLRPTFGCGVDKPEDSPSARTQL
jgi:hypothetical protein